MGNPRGDVKAIAEYFGWKMTYKGQLPDEEIHARTKRLDEELYRINQERNSPYSRRWVKVPGPKTKAARPPLQQAPSEGQQPGTNSRQSEM